MTADLSCYTAPLAGYLAGEYADAAGVLAASVHLAVRPDTDGPAFSHHRTPAGRLADGSHLRYAGAATATEALDAIGAQVDRDGRAIVVTSVGALPWSVRHGSGDATHWLLVDGRGGGRWHVVDDFAGLLPGGQQEPHAGWITGATLAEAICAPRCPSAVQRTRDRFALGAELSPPPAVAWLAPGAAPATDPGPGWLTGLDALGWLAGWFAAAGAAAGPWLDDVWTAARHYRFRLDWLVHNGDAPASGVAAAAAAHDAWRSLPLALRYAVESARRGRPRPTLVERAFGAVADAERGVGGWA